MAPPKRSRVLRKFGLMLIGLALFAQSCFKDDFKIVKNPPKQPSTPPTQPPIQPPPQTAKDACYPNVQYGYTDKVSYFPDEKITAYLQSNVTVDVCRLDIYDIAGNVAFSVNSPLTVQNMSSSEPYKNGYGFQATTVFDIPSGTASGIYLIENKIPVVIKTHDPVDLVVVYPSNTANAYCESGGKSLYTAPLSERPPIVSFHRPIQLQFFSYHGVMWFNQLKDYKIGYLADRDLDDYTNFGSSKLLVLIGHNEYWTRVARQNFDKYVDNGNNALILSGNTMWWQVRYSADGSQLICYKDQKLDPEPDNLLKTDYWDVSSLHYPIFSSICANFIEGGYGLRADQGWDGYKIASPNSPLLEGTNLKRGDIISIPSSEYDGAPLKGFDADGYPIIDQDALNVSRIELIGFDRGYRDKTTYGTFIIFQRSSTSGIVVNTATTDWCSLNGMGGSSGSAIKKITMNAITKLLNGSEVFSK